MLLLQFSPQAREGGGVEHSVPSHLKMALISLSPFFEKIIFENYWNLHPIPGSCGTIQSWPDIEVSTFLRARGLLAVVVVYHIPGGGGWSSLVLMTSSDITSLLCHTGQWANRACQTASGSPSTPSVWLVERSHEPCLQNSSTERGSIFNGCQDMEIYAEIPGDFKG